MSHRVLEPYRVGLTHHVFHCSNRVLPMFNHVLNDDLQINKDYQNEMIFFCVIFFKISFHSTSEITPINVVRYGKARQQPSKVVSRLHHALHDVDYHHIKGKNF